MNIYFSTLLCVLGIPAGIAFVPQTLQLQTQPAPSCRAFSDMTPVHMGDFDDDWHSDYEPSKYEQRPSSSYDGGYDSQPSGRGDRGSVNGRGGGRGGRGGRGRGRGRGGGRGGRGGGRGPKDLGPNGHDYQLTEDSGSNNSKFSEASIHALLAERLQAKFSRDFRTADSIQMELIDGGVFVNDGFKEWRADGMPYESFRDDGRGGAGRGARGMERDQYSKSEHSGVVEGASDELIDRLIKERIKFKMMRLYDKADLVREGLRTKFNVLVDDRLKQWSVGGDFGEEHNAQRELADKFSNRGYIKSTSSLAIEEEEEEYIQHHVEARTEAKKARDFDTADKIRLDLAQRFDVTINDKQKLWSIGGIFEEMGGKMGKPRGVYTRRGGGDLTEEEETAITKLISQRYAAKKQRNFDVADELRDDLYNDYNVKIDDRSNEWRLDTNDYAMNGANTLNEDQVALIDAKLKQRFQLKKEGEYESADIIRDDLREKLGVNIDDRTKEWYVEGRFAASPAAAPVEEDEAVAEDDVEEEIEAVAEDDDEEVEAVAEEEAALIE